MDVLSKYEHLKIQIKQVLLLVACLLIINKVNGQGSGSITGIITDNSTGESLPGANIYLEGTSMGTASGLSGEYILAGVKPGKYNLVIQFIGYIRRDTSIIIKEGETKNFDVALAYKLEEGMEVTITAQAKGQMAAINQQLNSSTIVNIVSKARLQELPDVNAAESVGRLPGAAIVRDGGEGTKVVVRGLEPKLNNIMINGVPVPATELEERGVDISMISPNILDGIELSKALSPDQDANAIGGTINFLLKQAPTGLRGNVMLQKGYNSEENSFKPLKLNGYLSNRLFDEKLGIILQASYDYADRSSDVLGGIYKTSREKEGDEEFAPIYLESLQLQDRKESRQKFSANLLSDFRIPNGNLVLNTLFSGQVRNQIVRGDKYSGPVRGDVYLEHSMREIESRINIFMTSLNFDYDFWGFKSENIISYSRTANLTPKKYSLTFREIPPLYIPGTSEAVSEYGPTVIQDHTVYDINSAIMNYMSSGSADGMESNMMIDLNFSYPIEFSKKISNEFKFGGKFIRKNRANDYEGRGSNMYYRTIPKVKFHELFPDLAGPDANATIKFPAFADSDYSEDQFVDGSFYIPYSLDNQVFNEVIDAMEPYLTPSIGVNRSDFETTEDVLSTYLMTTLKIGQDLTLLGGVRYEQNLIDMTAYGTDAYIDPTTGMEVGEVWPLYATNKSGLFFPALHIKYNLTDWFNIRFAKTKSVSRPSLGFMRPSTWADDVNLLVYRGNPDLNPSVSSNYDMVFSFFNSKFGLFAVSGFYKKIDDMYFRYIHSVLTEGRYSYDSLGLSSAQTGYTLFDYINSEASTYVKGIEFDLQPNLSFLPGFLKGLVLNVNYTKLFSDTEYPITIVKTVFNPDPPPFQKLDVNDTIRAGRMLRQSNDILNVSLGYDYKGFSCRVSLLFQGNTLSKVGSRKEYDGFTQNLLRLDFTVKQKIRSHFEVFANINNLNNRPDASYEPVNGFYTAAEYYGATVDLGIRYKFNKQ